MDKGYATDLYSSANEAIAAAYETARQSGNRISALRCAMDLVRREMATSASPDSVSILQRELDALSEPIELPLLVGAKNLLQSTTP